MRATEQLAKGADREPFEKMAPFGKNRTGGFRHVGKSFASGLNGSVPAGQEFLAFIGIQVGDIDRVTQPYRQNEWVNKCIDVITTAHTSAPLVVRKTADKNADIEENPKHPLVKLLTKLNRFFPRVVWERAGVAHMNLDGEDFWFMVDAEGRPIAPGEFPAQIFCWRGAVVHAELDDLNWPKEWWWDSELKFPLESVLHFRHYDPDNPIRGLGPVEVAMRKVAMQFQMERFEEGLLANGGQPSAYLKLPGKMSEPMRKEYEEDANDEIKRPENAGGIKVLEHGVEVESVGLSPKDMTNDAMSKRIRDAILAELGVPGPCLGIYEFATLDNFREAKKQLWEQTVIPYQEMRIECINEWVGQLNDSSLSRMRIDYDRSGIAVLQEDNTAKFVAATTMTQARIGLSFNNSAQMLGLDFDPQLGSDLVLEPQAVPDFFGTGDPREEEDDEERDDDEQESEDDETGQPPSKGVAVSRSAGKLSILNGSVADQTTEQAELRSYHSAIEKRVMIPADGRLKQVLMKFLRSYELAQVRKLNRVGKDGPDPEDLSKGIVSKDSRLVTAELIEKILLLNKEQWATKLAQAVKSPIAQVWKTSLAVQAAELGTISMNIADPLIVERIARQTFELSKVVDTLREQIKAAMLEVFAKDGGATIGELQQVIKDLVPELRAGVKDALKARTQRALVIARNETANAVNGARWEQMNSDEVEYVQWITSADSAVRASHRAIDGEIVSRGVAFGNGLKFPHQPGAPLDEVIQCRCVLRAVRKKEAAA